jgi:hypothetical protein
MSHEVKDREIKNHCFSRECYFDSIFEGTSQLLKVALSNTHPLSEAFMKPIVLLFATRLSSFNVSRPSIRSVPHIMEAPSVDLQICQSGLETGDSTSWALLHRFWHISIHWLTNLGNERAVYVVSFIDAGPILALAYRNRNHDCKRSAGTHFREHLVDQLLT